MTSKRSRRFLAIVASTAILVAACGGASAPSATPTQAPETATPAATPSPTPTPTPAPTPSPAPVPTPSPAPATTAFAFAPADVIAYYEGIGFACDEPAPAATFLVQQCFKKAKKSPTAMVSIAWSGQDPLTHYGYGGYYNVDGAKKPAKADAFEHLGGLIGALLGSDDGGLVGQWVIENFGDDVSDVYNGLNIYTYTRDEDPGSGYFVEIATQDFLDAVQGG